MKEPSAQGMQNYASHHLGLKSYLKLIFNTILAEVPDV
jgi:hypothetical protein